MIDSSFNDNSVTMEVTPKPTGHHLSADTNRGCQKLLENLPNILIHPNIASVSTFSGFVSEESLGSCNSADNRSNGDSSHGSILKNTSPEVSRRQYVAEEPNIDHVFSKGRVRFSFDSEIHRPTIGGLDTQGGSTKIPVTSKRLTNAAIIEHSQEHMNEVDTTHFSVEPQRKLEGVISITKASKRGSLILGNDPIELEMFKNIEVPDNSPKNDIPLTEEQNLDNESWIDSETGKVRRGSGMSIPDRKSSMNTFAAKVSFESRAYRRERNLGEHALSKPSGYQQLQERGIRRRASTCANFTERSVTSSTSASLLVPDSNGEPYIRNRMRFNTFGGPSCGKRASTVDNIPNNPGNILAVPVTTAIAFAKEEEAAPWGKQQEHWESLALGMKMFLLDQANVCEIKGQTRNKKILEERAYLLEKFVSQCKGVAAGLCFLSSSFEDCSEFVLPSDAEGPISRFVEETKINLFSPVAIARIEQMMTQRLYPSGIVDTLLKPLEIFRTIKVCDRRRSTRNLRLDVAKVDVALESMSIGSDRRNIFAAKNGAFAALSSSRKWGDTVDARDFTEDFMRSLTAAANTFETQNKDESCTSFNFSLRTFLHSVINGVTSYGRCSTAMFFLDKESGVLRTIFGGFVRLFVLRRSQTNGLFYRLMESPARNAEASFRSQIQNWPSLKTLEREKDTLHSDIVKESLMRYIALAEPQGQSTSGLLEQSIHVEEGDIFLAADEVLFDVIPAEEIRHLFSCVLTPAESRDMSDKFIHTGVDTLTATLSRIWQFRMAQTKLNDQVTKRLETEKCLCMHPKGVPFAYHLPTSIPIISGWIRNLEL